MPNETADLRGDLGDIRAKLDSALVGVRIAEKMALDASEAIERLYRLASSTAPRSPPQALERDPLAVSRDEACRLLSRSRQHIWRLIRAGRLELTDDGQITMASIRRVGSAKATRAA